jgi:DNA helicase-2/ATP-dependent DNA helicase PcrA
VSDGLRARWLYGIGARLLRDQSTQFGLDPAVTIHNRGNAADEINLLPHELGFSKRPSRSMVRSTRLERAEIGHEF